MNDAGEVLGVTKVANDPVQMSMAIAEAGPGPEAVLEACYGSVTGPLICSGPQGCQVHLPTPSACTGTAGLDETGRPVAYHSALLVNIGCHSDTHEQARWFGTTSL